MSKFDKKTIATVLAFAALLGNKTSATTINPQTVGAVGGAASSHSKTPKETQGMGIGARVAIGTAALFGAYATANEILGDTGLVNHPAMGRFTAKKTIEYWMRDVKKEEELIDRIIEFIDNSGAINICNSIHSAIYAKEKELNVNLLSGPNKAQKAKINKVANAILMEDKDLIPNIRIDSCSEDLETEEKKNEMKFSLLYVLTQIINNESKGDLLKVSFSEYSIGVLKFDLAKNRVFINVPNQTSSNMTMLSSIVLTLNNNGSLTFKFYAKEHTAPLGGKSMDNVNCQITIPAPKNPAPKK